MRKSTSTLFALALVGVLVVIGLALSALSWIAVVVYAAVVLVLAALMGKRARSLAHQRSGRTCTCCTTTVFDPVEVK